MILDNLKMRFHIGIAAKEMAVVVLLLIIIYTQRKKFGFIMSHISAQPPSSVYLFILFLYNKNIILTFFLLLGAATLCATDVFTRFTLFIIHACYFDRV